MNDLSNHPNLTVRMLAALAEGPKPFSALQDLGTDRAIRNRLQKLHEVGVISWGRRYKRWRLVS